MEATTKANPGNKDECRFVRSVSHATSSSAVHGGTWRVGVFAAPLTRRVALSAVQPRRLLVLPPVRQGSHALGLQGPVLLLRRAAHEDELPAQGGPTCGVVHTAGYRDAPRADGGGGGSAGDLRLP